MDLSGMPLLKNLEKILETSSEGSDLDAAHSPPKLDPKHEANPGTENSMSLPSLNPLATPEMSHPDGKSDCSGEREDVFGPVREPADQSSSE